MKVKIGPYQSISLYVLLRPLGKYMSENVYDYITYSKWFNKLESLVRNYGPERKTKVKLHPYDTWNLDHTLALIIHPALVQLRKTTHSYSIVDHSDIPLYIQVRLKSEMKDEDDIGELYWNWIMDEMIWTFEQYAREDDFYIDCYDYGVMGYDVTPRERLTRGTKLFGKYYGSLWD